MSKVIKNKKINGDVVTLGEPPVKIAKKLPEKPRISTEESLNFKGKIDSAIDNYVSLIEKSKVDKVFQGKYDQGFKDGLETEYSRREKYIDDHFSDTIKVIESLLIEKKGIGKMSVRRMINNFYYARHIDSSKIAQESVVEAAQAVTDEKLAELVEATKKKKVLDRLKDRKLEEHTKAELKEEQDYIDDIAVQRFNRGNPE